MDLPACAEEDSTVGFFFCLFLIHDTGLLIVDVCIQCSFCFRRIVTCTGAWFWV